MVRLHSWLVPRFHCFCRTRRHEETSKEGRKVALEMEQGLHNMKKQEKRRLVFERNQDRGRKEKGGQDTFQNIKTWHCFVWALRCGWVDPFLRGSAPDPNLFWTS